MFLPPNNSLVCPVSCRLLVGESPTPEREQDTSQLIAGPLVAAQKVLQLCKVI